MNMTKNLWKMVTALVFASFPLGALAVSWDGVPASEVGLFYPGQAAWEWVLTPSSHGGAKSSVKARTVADATTVKKRILVT